MRYRVDLLLIVVGLFLLAMGVLVSLAMIDIASCAKRGPVRISHFQQIGSVLMPVYVSDCVERVAK